MRRDKFFYTIFVISFVILLSRLFYLQIVKGAYYRDLSDNNRIKLEKVPADRGVIYDRASRLLARNTPEGRAYPFGESLAQVVGFIGKIDEQDWQKCLGLVNCHLDYNDYTGKLGIEKRFDKILSGQSGGILYETNSQGEKIHQISLIPPSAGQDIYLNLDAQLQQKALDILADRQGAVVISQPETGEILALVSSPSFDPAHPEQPGATMFNRAISGVYPPGSVFKIVTSAAGLQEGKITANTLIEDTGEIKIGEYRYGNWYFDQYGRTEGEINIVKALQRSNDIFFYKVGEWLGARHLANWARLFGLGQPTGIDLAGEAGGLVPDPDWKQEYKGERWFLGNTYHYAIGQGDLLVTPLQVNLMTNVIASHGFWCQPFLQAGKKPDCQDLKLNQETLDLITQGMIEVCQEGGTAFPFFNFTVNGQPVIVAGKTGTAQFGHPEDKTHAWFTGFLPDQNFSVTVLLEAAGEGSYKAAPVAKDLIDYYLKNQ